MRSVGIGLWESALKIEDRNKCKKMFELVFNVIVFITDSTARLTVNSVIWSLIISHVCWEFFLLLLSSCFVSL